MKKSVIITGSNRGIGRSMVKKFAEAVMMYTHAQELRIRSLNVAYAIYQK